MGRVAVGSAHSPFDLIDPRGAASGVVVQHAKTPRRADLTEQPAEGGDDEEEEGAAEPCEGDAPERVARLVAHRSSHGRVVRARARRFQSRSRRPVLHAAPLALCRTCLINTMAKGRHGCQPPVAAVGLHPDFVV